MDSAVLLAALLAAPVQLAATELDLPGAPPPRFLQFVQAPSLLMLQFEPPPCFCNRGSLFFSEILKIILGPAKLTAEILPPAAITRKSYKNSSG